MLNVLGIIEIDEVGLPELLSVNRRPAEVLTAHLSAPFVERGELLVVLVEVIAEVLELFSDFFINPGAVPQLDAEVEYVDHR